MCGLVAYSSFQTSALPLAWVSARRVGGLACTASGAGSWAVTELRENALETEFFQCYGQLSGLF